MPSQYLGLSRDGCCLSFHTYRLGRILPLRSEELDRGHGRIVAPAEAVAQDARVAAVALAVALGRLLEEGLGFGLGRGFE